MTYRNVELGGPIGNVAPTASFPPLLPPPPHSRKKPSGYVTVSVCWSSKYVIAGNPQLGMNHLS